MTKREKLRQLLKRQKNSSSAIPATMKDLEGRIQMPSQPKSTKPRSTRKAQPPAKPKTIAPKPVPRSSGAGASGDIITVVIWYVIGFAVLAVIFGAGTYVTYQLLPVFECLMQFLRNAFGFLFCCPLVFVIVFGGAILITIKTLLF